MDLNSNTVIKSRDVLFHDLTFPYGFLTKDDLVPPSPWNVAIACKALNPPILIFHLFLPSFLLSLILPRQSLLYPFCLLKSTLSTLLLPCWSLSHAKNRPLLPAVPLVSVGHHHAMEHSCKRLPSKMTLSLRRHGSSSFGCDNQISGSPPLRAR